MYEKLQIGYSPLSGNIYLGRTNPKKPNEWIGDKKDITNNFLQVLTQKFEPGTETDITVNGKPKYKVRVTEISE